MKRLIILIGVWMTCISISGQQVVHAEYFFDTDPGYGKGNTIEFTSGSNTLMSITLPLDALEPGLHNLFARVKDSNGSWSQTFQRAFMVQILPANLSPEVTRLEYFLDKDPGFGMASSVMLQTDTEISVAMDCPLDTMSDGIHTLYIRALDSNGSWGMTLTRSFLVQKLPQNSQYKLTRMEYFFDEDPGFGMANPIAFQTGAEITVAMDFPLDALSDGIHTLYIRAMDSKGSWGMTLSRSFLVQELPQNRKYMLTHMEYFFDEDPGFGFGTPIEFQSDNKTSVSIDLPLETLPDGIHNLYVRARDDKGSWGMTFHQVFMKFYTHADNAKVAAMEYFVNTDPGFGNGTRIDLNTPKPASMKYFVVDADKLQPGKNILYVRALDTRGTWGHVYTTEFEVLETAPCEPPSDLLANDVTEFTASLGWTTGGGSTDWDIMWVPADLDYTEDGTLDTAIQDNPYAAQELLQSTLYGFYVRTICSDGQVSDWAGPGFFHTLPLPLNQLTLLADPPEGGTFTGAGSYTWNEQVNISAIANDHFEFQYWSGDTVYLDNTVSADAEITMPDNAVTLTAHFLDLTGINEDPESGLRVFPNPAGERLCIEYYNRAGEILSCQLIEMRGHVVDQQMMAGAGMQRVWFNTSDLPPGMYLLKIHGDRWTATRKIIVWH